MLKTPAKTSLSSPSLSLLPSLETKGAKGELKTIKQETQQNRFNRFLNFRSATHKFLKAIKVKELSSEERMKSQIHFNLLKFGESEPAVHYKILSQNLFHLKVFKNLETAQEFIQMLFPNQKYVTFDQLVEASQETGGYDQTICETLLRYLRELGKDNELPRLLIRKKPAVEPKLFTTSRKGSMGSLRLSLIPRQRQAVVLENEDIDPKELENISLRKGGALLAEATTGSQRHQEASISIRMTRALQRGDSGYSYREEAGAKCGSATIITHKD
jgi:hypothetical protein